MNSASAIPTANPEQVDYWNSAAGERWLTHRATLDRQMSLITDRLFTRAAVRPGERVIDVGCGAGATTIRLGRAVGATGAVLGVDISEPMLSLATNRAAAVDQVRFERADAQVHGFDAAAYDLAFSRFGFMFFANPVAAFRNLGTAFRFGGRLCLGCWGPLQQNPWFRVPREIAIRHLGPPEPQPPHAPGPLAFADAEYAHEVFTAAGFEEVAITAEDLNLLGPATAEETAEFACVMGPAGRLIREKHAPADTVQAIAAEIAEAYKDYATSDGVRVPAKINFISARKP